MCLAASRNSRVRVYHDTAREYPQTLQSARLRLFHAQLGLTGRQLYTILLR